MNIIFYILLILLVFPYTAMARLELSVIRPVDEFVTNNSELIVEGSVNYSEEQSITVSISTPAGVPDLGGLNYTLRSITVDTGSTQPLTALVFSPLFKERLSYSPRVIKLFSSTDGQSYVEKGTFNCSSGMGQDYGEARSEFNLTINSRFMRIDMLDGWQSDKIGIQDVSFLDASGKTIRSKIRGISFGFNENDVSVQESGLQVHFQVTTLLREGENQISISSKAEIISTPNKGTEEDFMLVKAVYLPEVIITKDPIILSDGYKAEVSIPFGALDANIKKIGINAINVNEIESVSYAENKEIVKGTSPVLAYKFDVGAETPFFATAKDSLERQLPNLVVDGKPDYPSTWMTALSPLPVWLKVDLLSSQTIGKVIVIARIKDKVSYGPKRLSILVSNDDQSYEEVASVDECDDSRTEVPLSITPTARYVKLQIEEGKQGNNIQINEIEFRDSEGTKIIAYVPLNSVVLAQTAKLTMYYDDVDLTSAGIHSEKNLSIFSWDNRSKEWRTVGGKVDSSKNLITVNLNYLSTFAIFEASQTKMDVKWSYNPFSPNGDGIADTTTIFINLGQESYVQAKVEIFDYVGKLVRTLMQEEMQSGHISILWDGKDENGDRVEIGPYIYQVSVGKNIRNGTLIVAR
jgi:gliding motility-associated-like protein